MAVKALYALNTNILEFMVIVQLVDLGNVGSIQGQARWGQLPAYPKLYIM